MVAVRLLIAGVDPGTTVGYAFLDINGDVVAVGSGKELDLDSLVKKAREHGKPFVVGSDKAKTPSFVSSFATQFRAKVFAPPQDIKVDEKKDFVKSIPDAKWKNSHEFDTLASATFALSQVRGLIDRIRKAVREREITGDHDHHLSRVAELVIKHGMAIKAAIALIEEKEPEIKPLLDSLEAPEERRTLSAKTITKVYIKLAQAKQEVQALRKQNRALAQKAKEQGGVGTGRLSKRQQRDLAKKMQNTQKTIARVRRDRDKALRDAQFLARLASNRELIPLKMITNLGWHEVKRCQTELGVQRGDVLFVERPHEMSPRAQQWLREKEITLITFAEPEPAAQSLHIVQLQLKPVSLQRAAGLVFLPRAALQKILWGPGVVERVIKTYRASRS